MGPDAKTFEAVFLNFLASGFSGLRVLHINDYAHFDIKALNILVTKGGLKICTSAAIACELRCV
jgi:serine/threonine protein kinase